LKTTGYLPCNVRQLFGVVTLPPVAHQNAREIAWHQFPHFLVAVPVADLVRWYKPASSSD
jgi:hypothetical protein